MSAVISLVYIRYSFSDCLENEQVTEKAPKEEEEEENEQQNEKNKSQY